MRRWFAILLLALLPLQFSWAAVAAYCGHEADAQAQHLGHHAHQHAGHDGTSADASADASADESADAGADPAGEDGTAAFGFDCGHCHSSCCSMPALVGMSTPPAITAHPATPVGGAMRTRAQSPPDRPQWARFA